MQCNGVVGVYWLVLVGGSGELVRDEIGQPGQSIH